MTISEFITAFKDLLQRDEIVEPNTPLGDLDEWDSLSIMACMAWFSREFDINHPYRTYALQKTVQDIINLSNGNIV